MKKLTVIGAALVTVAIALVIVPAAVAKPTPSPEFQALLLRSEGMNQLYGIGAKPQLTLERTPSQRFAVGNPLRQQPVSPEYGLGSLTLERGLNERFASDNPVRADLVRSTPSTSVESSDFQWGDAGIGAGVLLAAIALLGTCFVVFRNHGHLRTS
jgi:hypothetical protein